MLLMIFLRAVCVRAMRGACLHTFRLSSLEDLGSLTLEAVIVTVQLEVH